MAPAGVSPKKWLPLLRLIKQARADSQRKRGVASFAEPTRYVTYQPPYPPIDRFLPKFWFLKDVSTEGCEPTTYVTHVGELTPLQPLFHGGSSTSASAMPG